MEQSLECKNEQELITVEENRLKIQEIKKLEQKDATCKQIIKSGCIVAFLDILIALATTFVLDLTNSFREFRDEVVIPLLVFYMFVLLSNGYILNNVKNSIKERKSIIKKINELTSVINDTEIEKVK